MQGWFKIHKSIKSTYHINRIKGKSHMSISLDAGKEKLLTNSTNPSELAPCRRTGTEGPHLHLVSITQDKLTTSLTLHGERLKGTRLRRIVTLINAVLDVRQSSQARPKMSGIQTGKAEFEWFLSADAAILRRPLLLCCPGCTRPLAGDLALRSVLWDRLWARVGDGSWLPTLLLPSPR